MALEVIDTLSDELRELAHAVYVEGVSLREYARRTGMGEKAVRARNRKVVDVLVPRVLRGG